MRPFRGHSGIRSPLTLIYRCGGSAGFAEALSIRRTGFPFNLTSTARHLLHSLETLGLCRDWVNRKRMTE